jgi:hypothetical protein
LSLVVKANRKATAAGDEHGVCSLLRPLLAVWLGTGGGVGLSVVVEATKRELKERRVAADGRRRAGYPV